MSSFFLFLLGGFQIERAGAAITAFESNKVRALLTYLAVERRAHTRSALAALLWPDHPEEMARTNLRHVLRQLRQSLPDPDPSTPLLLTTHQTIELNRGLDFTVDAGRFTQLLAACAGHQHPTLTACAECMERYRQAAELYRGDFLAGLSFYGSEPFEEWAVVQREFLHRQALELFFLLAAYYEEQGKHDQAQQYAHRQLALEPWREEAHRQLMRLLAYSGQRSAALAQFAQCRKILADELSVEPHAETVALYEQIRDGKLDKMTGRQDDKMTVSSRHPVILSSPHLVTLSPVQDWGRRQPPPISTVGRRKANSSSAGLAVSVVN
ncbi:MAG: bacterial transcriptional activator domain-containing protein [Caldilineaceae bacterium]